VGVITHPPLFELLVRHAVPLDENHYPALSHNAMAMDIYA
jgi:hypothetical protein